MTAHDIITIIEGTEGWEGWKDATIVWNTGEVELVTFVDWHLWQSEDEGKPPCEGEIVMENFSREAVVNWAIEFARKKTGITCNVAIGTFAN